MKGWLCPFDIAINKPRDRVRLAPRQATHFARMRISSGGLPDHAIGRLHAGFCADGNLTTSPWTAPQTNAINAFAVHGISPALGATIVGIGDSIMTSSCRTGQSSGLGIRACAIVSTPQLRSAIFNKGYPGRNSNGFCSCWTVIQHLKPQAALIQTWSGNELWTREIVDRSFARAMAVPIRRAATAVCRYW